jgi:aryl-alcohol dehydrogenase
MAAKICGAKAIIAIDPVAERRALAEELGATHSIDAVVDVEAAVREIAPHGVDFTFNTTTANSVYDLAIAVLGMRGVAGFVTRPRDPWTPQVARILAGGRSLRGILGGDANPQIAIPLMIEYWRQGRFPIEKMIRHYAFDDIETAWADNKALSAIKPVLKMEG